MTQTHKTRTRQRLDRVEGPEVVRQLHLLFDLVELLERDDCQRLTYGICIQICQGVPKV